MSSSTDRLLWQYRDKPNILALIRSYLTEFDEISDVLTALQTRLDIDASIGAQLDGIGEIVGQPRPGTVYIDDDDVFSFDGPGDGKGFSGINRPDIGGRFNSVDGLIVGDMPDGEYRVLLRAAIFATAGYSTLEHIAEYCQAVLGDGVRVHEGVGFVSISVPRPISSVEVQLIRQTIPLAAGVRLGYVSYAVDTVTGDGGYDSVAGDGSEFAGAFVGLA